MPEREKMVDIFNERFSPWDIELPKEAVGSGKSGAISGQGWIIWFLFGSEGGREYLDYYASHRMTDDGHVRIYADGERESLPSLSTWFGHRRDATPEEIEQARTEFDARNQAIRKMLEAKGFNTNNYPHNSSPYLFILCKLNTPENGGKVIEYRVPKRRRGRQPSA